VITHGTQRHHLVRALGLLAVSVLLAGCVVVGTAPAQSSSQLASSRSGRSAASDFVDPTIPIDAAAQQCEAAARTTLSMGECFANEEAGLGSLLSMDLTNLHALLDSTAAKADLDRAELAWNGYLAADCAFTAQLKAGGSQAMVDVAACRADDTLERVRVLQGYLVDACQGAFYRVECLGFRSAVAWELPNRGDFNPMNGEIE
jgi:uncharacterized protein YecT (DUF1311 family)